MKIFDIEIFNQNVIDIIDQQEFIGIRLSGGIDSATLCHIVLKYFPHVKILPITFYNVLRPNAIVSVENVLRRLKELNPNHNIIGHETRTFDTTGYVRENIDSINKISTNSDVQFSICSKSASSLMQTIQVN
jgi:tRNA(Ile)-lysidine synthase TilS/MesJ